MPPRIRDAKAQPGSLVLCVALALVTGACGRGCSEDRRHRPAHSAAPASPATLPSAVTPKAATRAPDLRLPVETDLELRLADRNSGQILPALGSFPLRRLREFDAKRHLVGRLDATSFVLLGTRLDSEALGDDAKVTAVLRSAIEAWQRRSGTAALRLVLAIDRETPAELAARVRRLAMISYTWRVVALARDGDQLVELLLSPRPVMRPEAATPTAR